MGNQALKNSMVSIQGTVTANATAATTASTALLNTVNNNLGRFISASMIYNILCNGVIGHACLTPVT